MTRCLRGLSLAACVLLSPPGEASPQTPGPLTIVALGTSLTEGIDWPAALGRDLGACLARPVRVERVAGSGQTSAWGLEQLDLVVALRPDIVLVEFAMNDANWRRFVSREQSRANTVAIGRTIRERVPGAKVVLMTTNVVHGLRGLMRPTVEAYYAQYREVAAAEGFGLIDLAPRWAALSSDRLKQAVPDGVHPTLGAFEQVALPAIVSALSGWTCAGTMADPTP